MCCTNICFLIFIRSATEGKAKEDCMIGMVHDIRDALGCSTSFVPHMLSGHETIITHILTHCLILILYLTCPLKYPPEECACEVKLTSCQPAPSHQFPALLGVGAAPIFCGSLANCMHDVLNIVHIILQSNIYKFNSNNCSMSLEPLLLHEKRHYIYNNTDVYFLL